MVRTSLPTEWLPHTAQRAKFLDSKASPEIFLLDPMTHSFY